jgi:hypothetical protein
VTFTAEGTHREIGSSGHVGGGRFGFR